MKVNPAYFSRFFRRLAGDQCATLLDASLAREEWRIAATGGAPSS